MYTQLLDSVVAASALLGALLGLYNFFHSRKRERVKLRVETKAAYPIARDSSGRVGYLRAPTLKDGVLPERVSVEVLNMSAFDVVVAEIGLARRWSRSRIAIPIPVIADGGPFPRKLSQRETLSIFLLTNKLPRGVEARLVSHVYAKTQCGSIGRGSSRALREMLKALSSEKATSR